MHRETFDQTHLRVEVWEKNEPPTIAVTFGGTVFWNEMDWRANLRWFLPKHRDEYSDVVQRFAPAFLEQLIRWLGPRPPETVRLISPGHSLGGGLAQQFAYAHCLDPRVPRVAAGYAFDPSPVTGFFSVKKSVRDVNRKTLAIDRIYERGEILAGVLDALAGNPSDPDERAVCSRLLEHLRWTAEEATQWISALPASARSRSRFPR